jgi:drug/metabolite transporter (DMT)-like permease
MDSFYHLFDYRFISFICDYLLFDTSSFLSFYFIWMKKSFAFPLKHAWKIILVGMIVAGHWMTFYYSIQLSTASLGILCLSTTTLHVTWLEPIVMKRKFSWMEFLFGLLVIFGIYFVANDFSAQERTALYYGLASALFAALFSVFNGRIAQEVESAYITLYELITGIIFISIVLWFTGKLTYPMLKMSMSDALWLLFLGVICTSFAFLMTIEIVKKLGAFTVSLSINLEPVYTIILAIFILKEHKLDKWGVGLQKSMFKYDKKTYSTDKQSALEVISGLNSAPEILDVEEPVNDEEGYDINDKYEDDDDAEYEEED